MIAVATGDTAISKIPDKEIGVRRRPGELKATIDAPAILNGRPDTIVQAFDDVGGRTRRRWWWWRCVDRDPNF
jgi:hypothetical protein